MRRVVRIFLVLIVAVPAALAAYRFWPHQPLPDGIHLRVEGWVLLRRRGVARASQDPGTQNNDGSIALVSFALGLSRFVDGESHHVVKWHANNSFQAVMGHRSDFIVVAKEPELRVDA